jgi:hypothetical protein
MSEPVKMLIEVPLIGNASEPSRFELVSVLLAVIGHQRFDAMSAPEKAVAIEAFHLLAKDVAA